MVGGATGLVVGRRAALPVLTLALGLAAPGRSAAQAPPPAPEPARVAAAFTAAWNAHDLPAVLALFAPDAVVRERAEEVPPAVWDTRDPQVVRACQDDASSSHDDAPSLVWVTGRAGIAAWAARRFARHSRFAADPPRAAGDTVGWSYREFVDPFQVTPGFSPAEGDAEAVARGGRIAVLSLVQSPASVRRRWDEFERGRGPGGGDSVRDAGRGRAERPAERATTRRRRTDRRGVAPGPGWARPPGRRRRGPAPAPPALRGPRALPQREGDPPARAPSPRSARPPRGDPGANSYRGLQIRR